MITRVHHVQIIAKDLDNVLAFFRDVLDLADVIQPTYETKGPMLDAFTGVPGTHSRIAKIWFKDFMIEIVQWLSPQGKEIKADWNDIGIRHICFEVDNVEEMYETLKERGVKFFSGPIYIEDKTHPIYGWAGCYFWGPENIMFELIQAPKEKN